MYKRVLGMGILCLGLVVLFAGRAVSQEGKHGGQPSPEEMAEMWEKMSAPDEHHEALKPCEGRWKIVSKWRMGSDQPWEESAGMAENKWVLGGRFLMGTVKSKMMGDIPFEGIGYTGFDKVLQKYNSFWIDSTGTGMMTSTGTADASGKTITWDGEYTCPMEGRLKKVKSVTRIINNDKHVFEMYDVDESGKEFMSLEVTYTR